MDLSKFTPKHRQAWLTDMAWGVELARLFGKRAGDMRYSPAGKGEPGSKLRVLHDNRMAAQAAWDAEKKATLCPAGHGAPGLTATQGAFEMLPLSLERTMQLTPEEIERYKPYHTMPAFARGFRDYQLCLPSRCPYSGDSVDGQAYDRGAECAMRRQRAADWTKIHGTERPYRHN